MVHLAANRLPARSRGPPRTGSVTTRSMHTRCGRFTAVLAAIGIARSGPGGPAPDAYCRQGVLLEGDARSAASTGFPRPSRKGPTSASADMPRERGRAPARIRCRAVEKPHAVERAINKVRGRRGFATHYDNARTSTRALSTSPLAGSGSGNPAYKIYKAKPWRSHSSTVPSSLAEASVLPSGLKATLVTAFLRHRHPRCSSPRTRAHFHRSTSVGGGCRRSSSSGTPGAGSATATRVRVRQNAPLINTR